jgi:NADH:ubiquinone oxidoreductase subunit K
MTGPSASHFFVLAAALFCLGLYAALRRRNAVLILMGIEMMLNAANLNLVAFARYLHPDPAPGQSFAVFVMAVAAAEVAVGLAIVLALARRRKTADVNEINLMGG